MRILKNKWQLDEVVKYIRHDVRFEAKCQGAMMEVYFNGERIGTESDTITGIGKGYNSGDEKNTIKIVMSFGYGNIGSVTINNQEISLSEEKSDQVELKVAAAPKYSIVVIDEVETSLHPRAQRRLIRDLANYSRERHVQFIVTTHSPFVMDELPAEARIHILLTEGKRTVVSGASPEFALSKMDDERHPEVDVYVEDERAKILVEEIIQAKSREHLLRIDVLPYGSASVGKSLGIMQSQGRFKKPTVVILDGDQDPAVGCSLLPGEDAPERVVFERLTALGWPSVATRVERSHSDLVDAANAAMTLPDHHDWVRHVADKVVVGGNELWRAMCRAYIAQDSSGTFSPLVDAIQAAFGERET